MDRFGEMDVNEKAEFDSALPAHEIVFAPIENKKGRVGEGGWVGEWVGGGMWAFDHPITVSQTITLNLMW